MHTTSTRLRYTMLPQVLSVRELVQEAMERAQQPLAVPPPTIENGEGDQGAPQAENADGWVEVTAEEAAQDMPVDQLDVELRELGMTLRQELANGKQMHMLNYVPCGRGAEAYGLRDP